MNFSRITPHARLGAERSEGTAFTELVTIFLPVLSLLLAPNGHEPCAVTSTRSVLILSHSAWLSLMWTKAGEYLDSPPSINVGERVAGCFLYLVFGLT